MPTMTSNSVAWLSLSQTEQYGMIMAREQDGGMT
jgi:hypothetical protein